MSNESSSSGEDEQEWVGNPQMGDNEGDIFSYNNMLGGGTDDELTENEDSQSQSQSNVRKH